MLSVDVPHSVRIVERIQESTSIFTWHLSFVDAGLHEHYVYHPGQFNMLSLPGIGEVPISIVSDPQAPLLGHTIRAVGRVTRAMARLREGDLIGLRGPFGHGWPLADIAGHDVLLITGGLGCAPLVSVIHYVMQRRDQFGRIAIIQGVKHAEDLIWRRQYEQWEQRADVQVLLAADVAGAGWRWHVGLVTDLLDRVDLDVATARVMMCGPEPMMRASASHLLSMGSRAEQIWLSMERNMQCATGHCGHCQYGPDFICKDGPVFALQRIHDRLGVKGL